MDLRTLCANVRHEEQNVDSAVAALQSLTTEPTYGEEWLHQVREGLEELHQHLPSLFRAEEGDVNESFVFCQSPTLGREADLLQSEHFPILVQLFDIMRQARATDADDKLQLSELHGSVHNLLSWLENHRNNERRLWVEALLVDVETATV